MVNFFNKSVKLGFIIYERSTVWEYTYGCIKKYRHALEIYAMTVLSALFVTIVDHGINIPGYANSVVGGLNYTLKCYLKEGMVLVGNLRANDTSDILMTPYASKYGSTKCSEQYLHILNRESIFNGSKSSKQ